MTMCLSEKRLTELSLYVKGRGAPWAGPPVQGLDAASVLLFCLQGNVHILVVLLQHRQGTEVTCMCVDMHAHIHGSASLTDGFGWVGTMCGTSMHSCT